jgi:sortase (surface protein transpeptidase)
VTRKHGWALILAGGALFVSALIAFIASPSETSGSPAAVEEALRVPASVDGPEPGPITTVTPPATVDESTGSSTTVTESEQAPPGDPESPEDVEMAQPVGLRIDALDVDAPVDPYGVVAATGQMDVPDNVTDVAWYKFGPSPGEGGSAVLAAHVDLVGQGPGVFFGLPNLEPDDLVHVAYDDGSEIAFRVVARTVYEKDELPTDVLFSKDGPPVLTLITCGGDFSRADRRYDSNVVVYAVPLDATDFPSGGAA